MIKSLPFIISTIRHVWINLNISNGSERGSQRKLGTSLCIRLENALKRLISIKTQKPTEIEIDIHIYCFRSSTASVLEIWFAVKSICTPLLISMWILFPTLTTMRNSFSAKGSDNDQHFKLYRSIFTFNFIEYIVGLIINKKFLKRLKISYSN